MNQQNDQARIAELWAARDAIDHELVRLGASDLSQNPEWINLATAAARCGRHPDRMAELVRSYGLGRRIGRAWYVDWTRVTAWMQRRPYVPIPGGNV